MEEEKLIRAAEDFLRLNRDYADTQRNFDLMRAVIEREKLDPSNISHLNVAWSRVKVITGNDPKHVAQSPAPVRPRQETVLPAMPAPQPEPVDDLTKAAQELIESHGGDYGFKTFFNNLTAKQMELEMRDFKFQRAVEICFPQTEASLLTRGDYVRGAQVVRAAEISGTDPYAAERAIAHSRDMHAQAYAGYQERAPGPEGGKPHWGPSFANRRTAQSGPRTMTASEARANELANAARSRQPEKSRADAVREAQLEEAKTKQARWMLGEKQTMSLEKRYEAAAAHEDATVDSIRRAYAAFMQAHPEYWAVPANESIMFAAMTAPDNDHLKPTRAADWEEVYAQVCDLRRNLAASNKPRINRPA